MVCNCRASAPNDDEYAYPSVSVCMCIRPPTSHELLHMPCRSAISAVPVHKHAGRAYVCVTCCAPYTISIRCSLAVCMYAHTINGV